MIRLFLIRLRIARCRRHYARLSPRKQAVMQALGVDPDSLVASGWFERGGK